MGLEASSGPKRVRYYRNPMGLPDTSPVPKKDSMGMDYMPVTKASRRMALPSNSRPARFSEQACDPNLFRGGF